jgi:hypothetical protein
VSRGISGGRTWLSTCASSCVTGGRHTFLKGDTIERRKPHDVPYEFPLLTTGLASEATLQGPSALPSSPAFKTSRPARDLSPPLWNVDGAEPICANLRTSAVWIFRLSVPYSLSSASESFRPSDCGFPNRGNRVAPEMGTAEQERKEEE